MLLKINGKNWMSLVGLNISAKINRELDKQNGAHSIFQNFCRNNSFIGPVISLSFELKL